MPRQIVHALQRDLPQPVNRALRPGTLQQRLQEPPAPHRPASTIHIEHKGGHEGKKRRTLDHKSDLYATSQFGTSKPVRSAQWKERSHAPKLPQTCPFPTPPELSIIHQVPQAVDLKTLRAHRNAKKAVETQSDAQNASIHPDAQLQRQEVRNVR